MFQSCPRCHSMLRGSSLRCWKCDLDLTRPFESTTAAPRPMVPVRGALPDAAIPRAERPVETSGAPGPAVHAWFVRTFDPRIDAPELDRAARAYDTVPWKERYRLLAALPFALLAVGGIVVGAALQRLAMLIAIEMSGQVPGNMAEMLRAALAATVIVFACVTVVAGWLVAQRNRVATVAGALLWMSALGLVFIPPALGLVAFVVAVAWLVQAGNRTAMMVGALLWLLALGLPMAVLWRETRNVPGLFVGGTVLLYVELVALWKALCVEFAHADRTRRLRPLSGAAA